LQRTPAVVNFVCHWYAGGDMGPKTGDYLSSILTDSFKREVDLDEAVWRSLPFFGAMLGLATVLAPPIYRSTVALAGSAWSVPVYMLLALSLLCFVAAARSFWEVIRLRNYRYPPMDLEVLAYAAELHAAHRRSGRPFAQQDEAVRDEVRTFILQEIATSTANNRVHNAAKLRARSQVLLFAMAGFLIAFLCEATILMAQSF
jgi:hypothetical protein